jgi:hypothetical protein
MSAVKQAVAEYLALRRSLGFKLKKHSRMLNEFAAFLEKQGALHITSQSRCDGQRNLRTFSNLSGLRG